MSTAYQTFPDGTRRDLGCSVGPRGQHVVLVPDVGAIQALPPADPSHPWTVALQRPDADDAYTDRSPTTYAAVAPVDGTLDVDMAPLHPPVRIVLDSTL